MAPRADPDSFVVITCQDSPSEGGGATPNRSESVDPLYNVWDDQSSAKFLDPGSFANRRLRELYPDHAIVRFSGINILGYPGAYIQPIAPSEIISNLSFYPLGRRDGHSTGVLVNDVKFGAFSVSWDKYDFILYVVKYIYPSFEMSTSYLLSKGSDQPARALIAKAAVWNSDLHEEIYVFDSGFWFKDHNLWTEVQKANWDDIILKEEFKTSFKKDVFGFFESEELYKDLGIPWKRGIIMHGPPGNGKTISMKAVMKDSDAKGYYPLYVKSFRSWKGEEGAMADVFEKARQMAPCVLILEDLDSLINDKNRSFFLNQLDGLEGNDGLLVIGTTNHLDRIDPALKARPSRFDRKFSFDDPDKLERKLYAQYWQKKLKSNKKVDFSDSLVDEIADTTDKFSFAYLKEVFVSSLVLLAGQEEDNEKASFASVIRKQIKTLRKQLNTVPSDANAQDVDVPGGWNPIVPLDRMTERPRLDSRLANQTRVWDSEVRSGPSMYTQMPGDLTVPGRPGGELRGERDLRAMANAAAKLGRSFIF